MGSTVPSKGGYIHALLSCTGQEGCAGKKDKLPMHWQSCFS